MKRFIAAGGLLAVAVSAGSAGTIMFNAQGPLDVGSNDLVQFDVRIEVSQTEADAALPDFVNPLAFISGFGGDFIQTGSITTDEATTLGYTESAFVQSSFTFPDSAGQLAGLDVQGVDQAQNLFGLPAGGGLTLDIGTIGVQLDGADIGDTVSFTFGGRSDITVAAAPLPFTAIATLEATDISSDTFTVVPTPASAAIMGFGGLAAARRRR